MKKLTFLSLTILIVLVLTASIIGCGETQSTGQIYENEWLGYSCRYPADWELQASPAGNLVLFAGPMDAANEFRINVNIVTDELINYAGISLDDYTEISEIQFQESLGDYQRLALNDASIGGMAARLITYSFSLDTLNIKGTQAFFIRDDIAYIITYSATPDSFDEYYPEFELVYASFQFD